MSRCLVGLKDGRVVAVVNWPILTDADRISLISKGCDSVITMDIEDAPDWKSQVKIKLEVGEDG